MKPPSDGRNANRPKGGQRPAAGTGARGPASNTPGRPPAHRAYSAEARAFEPRTPGHADRKAADKRGGEKFAPATKSREDRRPPPDRSGGPRPRQSSERHLAERQPAERVRPAPAAAEPRPERRAHTPDAGHGATPKSRLQAPPAARTRNVPADRNAAGGARPGSADAPHGTLWIYGTHAVAAALANPARRLRRLLVTEEAEAAIAARLPQPWPLGPERADRPRLELLLGRNIVHQGAALLADPLAPPSLQAVLLRSGPVLVLDQVTDPRNVGAILRSAAAFGVAAVITQDRNSPEETGALAKAASGALEIVPLLRAVNIARTLVALRAAGCWVIGLDASGAPLAGPALAQRRVALVLGNEGEGMRRLTRETCDELAGIAMPGGGPMMESLNVATAAAVALYEMARR